MHFFMLSTLLNLFFIGRRARKQIWEKHSLGKFMKFYLFSFCPWI